MGALTSLPAIEFAQRTHPGRDPTKQVNEDACDEQPTPFGHLAVVCDGMGGHEHGREASAAALATIFDVFAKAPPDADRREVLRAALVRANQEVRGIGEQGSHARPGSTVVAVLLHAGGAEIAHVGDSRCYLVHEGKLTQLTRDHSMVQQMVDAGFITVEEAATHPDANKISRALGMKADVDVEVRPEPIPYVSGDAFILCSDGLSDMVSEEELLHVVAGAPALQAVGQLVELANAHGGHDNITVQVLRPRESAAQQPGTVAPTVVDSSPPAADARAAGRALPAGGTQAAPVPRAGKRTTQAAPAARASSGDVVVGGASPPSSRRGDGRPSDAGVDEGGRSSAPRTVALVLVALGLIAAGAAIYIVVEHPASPVRTTPSFAASGVTAPIAPASTAPPAATPAAPSAGDDGAAEVVDAALSPHVPTPGLHTHHRPPLSPSAPSRAAPAPPAPPPLPPSDDSH